MSDKVKRWIEVEEQAHPEHTRQVLVTINFIGRPDNRVVCARWDYGCWDWGSPEVNAIQSAIKVLAWREMPSAFDIEDDVTAPVTHKLYVWRHHDYLAIAHAKSVSQARDLVLEENNSAGDDSMPVRIAALKAVRETTPYIHYRANAEIVLTASGETQELDLLCETLDKQVEELRAQLSTKNIEIQQLKDQLLLAQGQVNALSLVKDSNDKATSGD